MGPKCLECGGLYFVTGQVVGGGSWDLQPLTHMTCIACWSKFIHDPDQHTITNAAYYNWKAYGRV